MLVDWFVAVISGWVVTESGRQPWLVQGILRTADATSPVARRNGIAGTLALFVLAYGVVFWFGIYYINRLIALGPHKVPAEARGLFAEPNCRGARCRARSDAALKGVAAMEWYLPLIWAALIGTAVFMYVHSRRIRSGHRNTFSVHEKRERARSNDPHHRSISGTATRPG